MKRIAVIFFAAAAAASQAAPAEFVPGELLVKYRADRGQFGALTLPLHGAVPIETIAPNLQRIRIPANANLATMIAKLQSNPNVEFAEPNFIAHASLTPNDTYYLQYQPELKKIQVDLAWDISNGSGIKVAVLDTGAQANHPDLAGKVVLQYDCVTEDAIAEDVNGHGTHTAGTIGANTNNGTGVAGVGYGCQLMIGKVLGNNGSGTYADIIQGLRWAADNKAKIISMSLGGSSGSQALNDAVNYAWNKSCLLFAAAGNSNSSAPNYPAWYSKCIAVGAVDNNDVKASFSNYGSWVDLVAPGVNIASTYPTNQYALLSGTSMATPIAAGSAALVWKAAGTSVWNGVIRTKLTTNADFVTFGGISTPRVNPYKAITLP